MELHQIAIIVAGILCLVGIAIAYFCKKDYLKYSKLLSPILTALLSVLKAVGGILPNNQVITAMIKVIASAIEAAGYAENLWLQGEIDKAMRPKYAQEYIRMILESAGIEITDNIQTIISGVIALTCYLMPHYENKEEE